MGNDVRRDERPSLFGGDEPKDDGDREADDPQAPPDQRRGWLRRHPIAVAALALLIIVVLAAASFAYYLNEQLGRVDTVAMKPLPESRRPAAVGTEAVNILLAGVDQGDGRSVAEIAAGGWDPGVVRSDTIMVVHLTADREQAYVVSVPRDSYVRLYDETGRPQQMDKVNAALSLFGPTAYRATLEQLTGIRMQHLAVIDWAGFENITDALGGVTVSVPNGVSGTETGSADTQQVLDGEEALRYVRQRYSLPDGDFGRIDRQQNFIRSMMRKLLDAGTLSNPLTLAPTLRAVTGSLTVDESLDAEQMRNLALSLRGIDSDDVTFVTAPFGSFDSTASGASIVRLDRGQSAQLWEAVRDDDIASYLAKYGEAAGRLPAPRDIG